MIDRQHGNLVFECDGCGDTFETGGSEFAYVWPEARHEGWLARRVGEKIVHECPRCIPKSAVRTARQIFGS